MTERMEKPAEEAKKSADAEDPFAGTDAVKLTDFSFRYSLGATEKGPYILQDLSLTLPRGARCLLVGGNGAGKSTFLKAVGGMHMLFPATSVTVLGREAFGDRTLNSIRPLMQTEWATRSVAFAGYSVPLSGDFPVKDMNKDWQERFPERREQLVDVLGLDLNWKMNSVSDGQRRRVQLFLNMIRPYEVLLLDEVLSVLDVLVRQDILTYIKNECVKRNTTVIYATHIFDGLDDWPTHILYLKKGGVVGYLGALEDIPEYQSLVDKRVPSPLFRLVEHWLRQEKAAEIAKPEKEGGAKAILEGSEAFNAQNRAGGYTSGRMIDLDSLYDKKER